MTWDAISGIAEAVGAVGVIFTLLYLAVQIRQANAQGRATAYREIHRDIHSCWLEIAKDPDLHGVWHSAFVVGETLNAKDADRVGMLLHQTFGGINAGYQSRWQDRRLEDYVDTLTDNYLSSPYVRGWWTRQGKLLPEPFRSYVDGRLTTIVEGTKGIDQTSA